jgi:hypothetical protein
VAAAEIGVALAVVLLLFRRRGDIDLLAANALGEPNDVPANDGTLITIAEAPR